MAQASNDGGKRRGAGPRGRKGLIIDSANVSYRDQALAHLPLDHASLQPDPNTPPPPYVGNRVAQTLHALAVAQAAAQIGADAVALFTPHVTEAKDTVLHIMRTGRPDMARLQASDRVLNRVFGRESISELSSTRISISIQLVSDAEAPAVIDVEALRVAEDG